MTDLPKPTGMFPPRLSPDEARDLVKRRRGRNIAMLVVLVGISVLFYAIAIVKLHRPDLAQ